jgi:translation initiation factor 1 (eIF-1/SUI1)
MTQYSSKLASGTRVDRTLIKIQGENNKLMDYVDINQMFHTGNKKAIYWESKKILWH